MTSKEENFVKIHEIYYDVCGGKFWQSLQVGQDIFQISESTFECRWLRNKGNSIFKVEELPNFPKTLPQLKLKLCNYQNTDIFVMAAQRIYRFSIS